MVEARHCARSHSVKAPWGESHLLRCHCGVVRPITGVHVHVRRHWRYWRWVVGNVYKRPSRVIVMRGCRVDMRCVAHGGRVHAELLLDLHVADVHVGGGTARLVATPGVPWTRGGLRSGGSLPGGHCRGGGALATRGKILYCCRTTRVSKLTCWTGGVCLSDVGRGGDRGGGGRDRVCLRAGEIETWLTRHPLCYSFSVHRGGKALGCGR